MDWGIGFQVALIFQSRRILLCRNWKFELKSCNTNMMNESPSKTGESVEREWRCIYLIGVEKKRKERHFVGRVPGPSLILCVERGLPSLVRLQSRPSSVSERMWRSVGPVDTHEIRPKWWPNNWPNFLLKKKDANKFSVCFVLMGRVRLAGCGSGASLWLPALLLLLLLTVGVLVGTFALFYRVSSHLFST